MMENRTPSWKRNGLILHPRRAAGARFEQASNVWNSRHMFCTVNTACLRDVPRHEQAPISPAYRAPLRHPARAKQGCYHCCCQYHYNCFVTRIAVFSSLLLISLLLLLLRWLLVSLLALIIICCNIMCVFIGSM